MMTYKKHQMFYCFSEIFILSLYRKNPKYMHTSRRSFLSAASLSTLGLAAASTIGSLFPNTHPAENSPENGATDKGATEELEDFIYDIEHGSKGWSGEGGTA